MKGKLTLLAAWFGADSRRAKVVSFTIVAGLMLVGAIVPSVALAGLGTAGGG